jgi:aryl-alcohol dehydrogenase-like predicted oxidoreductase
VGVRVSQIDVEGARQQINLAREAGANLFDTADIYSAGLSEEILGKALGPDRDEVLIATKVRLPTGEAPNDAGLSRHHIMRSVDASLRRLGTDYIGAPASIAQTSAASRAQNATRRTKRAV